MIICGFNPCDSFLSREIEKELSLVDEAAPRFSGSLWGINGSTSLYLRHYFIVHTSPPKGGL